MPQIIEVPGVGPVEFPDGMTDAAITEAIQKNILPNYNKTSASAEGGPRPRQPSTFRGSVESALSSFINSLAFGIPEAIDRATRPERAAVYQQRAAEYPMAQSMGQISGEVLPMIGLGGLAGLRLGQRANQAIARKVEGRIAAKKADEATPAALRAESAADEALEGARMNLSIAEENIKDWLRASRFKTVEEAVQRGKSADKAELMALMQQRNIARGSVEKIESGIQKGVASAKQEVKQEAAGVPSRLGIPQAIAKTVLPTAGAITGSQIGAGTAGAVYSDKPGYAHLYSDTLGGGIRGTLGQVPGLSYAIDPLTRIVPGAIGLGSGLSGLYDR